MEAKTIARTLWGLGDYHRFATATVWELGPVLVKACGISRGQRVLDVAAGSGNVALRAAEAGAQVVASDLAPENLAAGRREARTRGLELEWVDADAEALPFAADSFDVVTSSFYAGLADQPERRAGLDRDFPAFATRSNRGPAGGPAEYPYEYLLVVGGKRG